MELSLRVGVALFCFVFLDNVILKTVAAKNYKNFGNSTTSDLHKPQEFRIYSHL